MRAIALSQFSKPANYNIASLPVPAINKPNELLIKVHAASINPVDVKMASPQVGGMMDTTAFVSPLFWT
jgi:NADPH:quinone reductase-like Zn-dependent oxidoreductase